MTQDNYPQSTREGLERTADDLAERLNIMRAASETGRETITEEDPQ